MLCAFAVFFPEVLFHSRYIGTCPVPTGQMMAMSPCENSKDNNNNNNQSTVLFCHPLFWV